MSSSNASQSGCYWVSPDEITLVQQECDELHYHIYSFRDLVGFESRPIMDDLFTQLSQAQDGAGDLHAAVHIRERGDALGLQDAELQCTSEYQTFNGIKNQLKELKTNFDTISKSGIDNPALKDALEAPTPEQRKAVQLSIDALCLQNRNLKEDVHLTNASNQPKQEQIEKLRAIQDCLEQDVVEAKKEVAQASRQLESLRQVGKDQRKQHAEDKKTWKEQKTTLERTNRDQLTTTTRRFAENADLREQIKPLKAQKSDLERQLAAANTMITLQDASMLRMSQAELDNQVAQQELQQEVTTLKGGRDRKDREVRTLKNTLRQVTEQKSKLASDNERIKQTFREVATEMSSFVKNWGVEGTTHSSAPDTNMEGVEFGRQSAYHSIKYRERA